MEEDPSDVIGESLEDSANVNRKTVVKEDYSYTMVLGKKVITLE